MDNSIEKIIEKRGFYAGKINGISMLPTIHNHTDVVFIEKIKNFDLLKKYDIILYRRSSNQLVLHRIIGCNNDGTFLICGDGETIIEDNVSVNQIIGKVTKFYRKQNLVNCSSFPFNVYSIAWCKLFFL